MRMHSGNHEDRQGRCVVQWYVCRLVYIKTLYVWENMRQNSRALVSAGLSYVHHKDREGSRRWGESLHASICVKTINRGQMVQGHSVCVCGRGCAGLKLTVSQWD